MSITDDNNKPQSSGGQSPRRLNSTNNKTANPTGSPPRQDSQPGSSADSAASPRAQAQAQAGHEPEDDSGACRVCRIRPHKYKCTICYLPFCSSSCGKLHRQTHPPDAKRAAVPKPAAIHPDPATSKLAAASTRPKTRFSILENDRRVAQLFIKYPDLEEQLWAVDNVARPSDEDKIRTGWNNYLGRQRGVSALRDARELHPGIQEFSELVTHLLSGEEGLDSDRRTDRPTQSLQ